MVAWYLPSFASPSRDLRRSLAAIRFATPDGQRFDSFALDIESSIVRSVPLRNAHLLALGRRLRAAAGPDYALGAIIPSPVGMQLLPRYWPGFPYAQLARTFDVFLPMDYYTHRVHGAAAVYAYTTRGMTIIRERTGVPDLPIHVIGGLAGATTAAEARSFVVAVGDCGAAGAGLYDFDETTSSQWLTLESLETPSVAASACSD